MARFLPFLFVAFSFSLWAQQIDFEVRELNVERAGIADPRQMKEDFQVSVDHVEAPFPGGEAARSARQELKQQSAELFPRTGNNPAARGSRSGHDSLTILDSFSVRFFFNDNILAGGTPNDNTLAISDDNMLLTSWNSQIWGYDLDADTFLFHEDAKHPSFNQFISFYTDTTYSLYFPFDPKLIYDPIRDRFIFVFLTGRDPSNSAAIVAFSSTNYPTDPWYTYWLDGDPLSDSTWTDYPQMAINENSFYLTLNQLYPDSSWITGFSQTVIWQMDLDAAFAGQQSVPTKLWSGMEYGGEKLRYLRPAKTGRGPESDSMFFVCNRPFDLVNDSIFLVRLEGDAQDPNATIDVTAMKADTEYGFPPDGVQPNGHTFQTNDARALGAVRIGQELHFVGNTVEPVSGQAGVYHGIIKDLANPTVEGNIIAHDSRDIGYPNISFVGPGVDDKQMVIFFNHTAADAPAGNSAVLYTNDRDYGPIQSLIEGDNYVDRITGTEERWGDYSGIQRKFNEDGIVWVAGYTSFGGSTNGTWVTKLGTDVSWPTGDEPATMVERKSFAYPNPAVDQVTVRFELEETSITEIVIYDAQGRWVKTLARDRVKAGVNELNFNMGPLPSGHYMLVIKTEDRVLHTQPLVKQ